MELSLENLDEVLVFLGSHRTFQTLQAIMQSFEDDYEGEVMYARDFYIILDRLYKDGYIIKEAKKVETLSDAIFPVEVKVYCISYEGILFLQQGGYRDLTRRLQEDRRNEEWKNALTVTHIESSIETNDSVKRNNKFQRNITIASILIAAAALFTSSVQAFKDDSVQIRQQNLLLKQQVQILDKLRQSLEERLPFAPLDSSKKSSFPVSSPSKDNKGKE